MNERGRERERGKERWKESLRKGRNILTLNMVAGMLWKALEMKGIA